MKQKCICNFIKKNYDEIKQRNISLWVYYGPDRYSEFYLLEYNDNIGGYVVKKDSVTLIDDRFFLYMLFTQLSICYSSIDSNVVVIEIEIK